MRLEGASAGRLLNRGLTIVALAVFGWYLYRFDAPAALLQPRALAILLGCAALYVAPILSSGLAWALWIGRIEAGSHGIALPLHLFMVSQIAKYLPGNVGHHVGRLLLARREGMGGREVLFSMLLETLWVIAISSLLALAALWQLGARLFAQAPRLPEGWLLVSIAIGAALLPLLGHRLFARAAGWLARRRGVEARALAFPPLRVFAETGLLYLGNYLLLGVILKLIGLILFDADLGGILLLAGIFSVAWIVGFVTPGAPAGLGVRELVLVAALTPLADQPTAVGVAAALRVVTVLGDGLAFLLGIGLGRLLARRSA